MPQIQLQGGEQDGLIFKITAAHPEIFYALPHHAEQLIHETVGAKAKVALREKFSILAYRFSECVTKTEAGLEYRYLRAPELDLTPPGT